MDGARNGQRNGAERASSACCSLRATCAGCVIQCGSCFVRARTCGEPQGQHAQSSDSRNKGGGAEANAEGDQEATEEERRLPRAAPARAHVRGARTHPRAARPRLSPAFAIERKNANAASLNESIFATGKLLTHAQPTTHSLQIKPRSFTAGARYNWLRPRPHSLASPSTPLSSVNSHSTNPLSPSPSLPLS